MRQTIIGITTSIDREDLIRPGVEYSYVRREYAAAVHAVGAQPILLTPSISPEAAAELCDGIIISGGDDIHPGFYGEELTHGEIMEKLDRTEWEMELIAACDEVGVPILGICYGHQLLNVYYGGNLYQDIVKETDSDFYHGDGDMQVNHGVTFREDFMGFKAGEKATIASRHHQAIKTLAPGFRAVVHADDGTIEAMVGHGHYGMQWHVESDDSYKKIYGAFAKLCQPRSKQNVFQRIRIKN